MCPRVCAVFVVFQFPYKHVNNFQLIAQIRRGLDFYCIARGAACRTNSQIHLRVPPLPLSLPVSLLWCCCSRFCFRFAISLSIGELIKWKMRKASREGREGNFACTHVLEQPQSQFQSQYQSQCHLQFLCKTVATSAPQPPLPATPPLPESN